MLTQQKIKDIILSLELKYPVDTWKINDIHVWPYIRIKIYIRMLVLMNEKPLNSIKIPKKKKVLNKGIVFFRNFLFLLEAQFCLVFFFLKLRKKKLMFFGSHIHRVLEGNQYFNRFYDSMIDFHELQNDVYTIEYQDILKPTYNEKSIIPLKKHLDYYKFINKIVYKYKKREPIVNLDYYDDFYEELSKLDLKLDTLRLSQDDLIKWTYKIDLSKGFFERLYKKTNPNKVIFLGYYGLDDLYAALIVANNFKITTVDFQHGPQTNIHLAFSSWNKIPKKGFNTLPKEFWNWDKASQENIESWANKTDAITAKVVGQPYLAYWLDKKQTIINKKDYIFYSLQTTPFTIQDMLTPKVIALIKELKYQWVLRLHPRNNIDVDTLKVFLKENEIEEKTIIQDAFNTPLPKALVSSLIHVTNYSGCLIESYQLGVPTLIINEVGYEMFSQYIDGNLVHYLNQDNENFKKKVVTLINNLDTVNYKSNYSQVFNPLNEY